MTTTSRRKVTSSEMDRHRGDRLEKGLVYIGRTPNWRGEISKWANPFKIGKDGSREDVIAKFIKYKAHNLEEAELGEIRGRTLLCHCGPGEACHGDVLIDMLELAEEKEPEKQGSYFLGTAKEDDVMLDFIEDGLPDRVKAEAREEIDEQKEEGGSGSASTSWKAPPPENGELHGQGQEV